MKLLAILHIPVSENTSKEPIRYFDEIVSKNYIEFAKTAFFEDFLTYIESQAGFPAEKDFKKETITIDYQQEVDWDEFKGPVYAWKTNVYSFDDALKKTLEFKVRDSFSHLNIKAESEHKPKSKKEFFANIVRKISDRYDSISNEERFTCYRDILTESLSYLLGGIYFKHPNLAPKKTLLINEILEKSEKGNLSYEPMALKSNFLTNLITFKLLNEDKTLMQIENELQAINDFRYLSYKMNEKFIGPIKINTDKKKISAIYYILTRLAFYLGHDEKYFNGSKFFTINDKPFSANSAYTAKNRLPKQKNNYKLQIDTFFQGQLS